MRFFRRALTGIFLLAVTVGLLALTGRTIYSALEARWAEESRPIPARERVYSATVATIETGTVTPVLTAFGEIRSRRTLELRAPVGGEVVELSEGFEDGGTVAAGQLLMRIDPAEAQSARDLAAADLREAEVELADARRAVELAGEDLAAARAQAELRQRALTRQRDLAERGVGSPVAVEEAELAAAAAEQSILSRRQALAQAESRAAFAETALERRRIAMADAERRLADTELRAEFDGLLTGVEIVAGGLVTANERVATLIDADALEVAFRVSTAQYARLLDEDGTLRPAPVTVTLDVMGFEIAAPARLARESGAVAEGQSGRLLFAELEETRGFRVGDFVTATVEEPPLSGVAVLPAAAVGNAGEVLVLGAEDRLEEARVELLRRQGDDVIVRADGLEGREIVQTRSPVLGAGIRVAPVRPGAEASGEPETLSLDPARRARLIAFVEGNGRMPEEVRERLLRQLEEEEVPAETVRRLESRMGS